MRSLKSWIKNETINLSKKCYYSLYRLVCTENKKLVDFKSFPYIRTIINEKKENMIHARVIGRRWKEKCNEIEKLGDLHQEV